MSIRATLRRPASPTTARRADPAPAGRPLDATTRTDMEHRLGHDFASVRVHAGARGAAMARAHAADALAIGEDISFAPGRFAPGTAAGDGLLAHELAHVAQQRAAIAAPRVPIASAETAEREAGTVARAPRSHRRPALSARPLGVHRQPSKPPGPAGITKAELAARLKAILGHDVTITVGDKARQERELGGPAAKRKLPATWKTWDPGASSTLYERIVDAFTDVGREVGGLPDVREVVFYFEDASRRAGWLPKLVAPGGQPSGAQQKQGGP